MGYRQKKQGSYGNFGKQHGSSSSKVFAARRSGSNVSPSFNPYGAYIDRVHASQPTESTIIPLSELERIRAEGLANKPYILFTDLTGREALIVNKMGPLWWQKATIVDLEENVVY